MRSYIHIDGGINIKGSKVECQRVAETVKKDWMKLGLVTSSENCCWTPVQFFTRCGCDWDLQRFRVSVTKEKKDRIKAMARRLFYVTGSARLSTWGRSGWRRGASGPSRWSLGNGRIGEVWKCSFTHPWTSWLPVW